MTRPRLPRKRYPALADFVTGYLNQDVFDIYGSPAEAANAFRAEASVREVEAVYRDWLDFLDRTASLSAAERRDLFARSFDPGWLPRSFRQLTALFDRLGPDRR